MLFILYTRLSNDRPNKLPNSPLMIIFPFTIYLIIRRFLLFAYFLLPIDTPSVLSNMFLFPFLLLNHLIFITQNRFSPSIIINLRNIVGGVFHSKCYLQIGLLATPLLKSVTALECYRLHFGWNLIEVGLCRANFYRIMIFQSVLWKFNVFWYNCIVFYFFQSLKSYLWLNTKWKDY